LRFFFFNSFYNRANADDGLLCGVLLLPMVAASKVIDASRKSAEEYRIGKKKKK
jgi:hypothetical protein